MPTQNQNLPSNVPANLAHSFKRSEKNLTDDVNPLIKSSPVKIDNLNENFIVLRTSNGDLKRLGARNSDGLMKKLFQRVEKYYEVDSRPYSFMMHFYSPTAQISYNYTVSLEFELQVADPCKIVELTIVSLLNCVARDLKKLATLATERYEIKDSMAAVKALRATFESFQPPTFLVFKPGEVNAELDDVAKGIIRNIEEAEIRGLEARAQANVGMAQAILNKYQEGAGDHVGDDRIGIMVDKFISSDPTKRIGNDEK